MAGAGRTMSRNSKRAMPGEPRERKADDKDLGEKLVLVRICPVGRDVRLLGHSGPVTSRD